MYKCERCDWTGSSSELSHYTEYRGECHGALAFERERYCPACERGEVIHIADEDEE